MGMLEALHTGVLAEPWLLLLVLALGSYFVLVHRPRAAGTQKAVVEKEAAKQKAVVEKEGIPRRTWMQVFNKLVRVV